MNGQVLLDYLRNYIDNDGIVLLDISHWQGTANIQKLKDFGIAGVYIKVGDPWMQNWADPTFEYYRHQCISAGMDWGGFWFFRQEYNGIQQGDKMLELMGGYHGELPPAADCETSSIGTSMTTAQDRLRDFLNDLFLADRRIPGIYTRKSIWDTTYGTRAWMSSYWWWVAQYNENIKFPTQPKPMPLHTLHQKWADGDLIGPALGFESGSVDVDLFNGDKDMFVQWKLSGAFPLGHKTAPVPPPPPPLPPPSTYWGSGTTKVNLNLRSTAGGTLILTMPKGSHVDILDPIQNGWYHINYSGTIGWCSGNSAYIDVVAS